LTCLWCSAKLCPSRLQRENQFATGKYGAATRRMCAPHIDINVFNLYHFLWILIARIQARSAIVVRR